MTSLVALFCLGALGTATGVSGAGRPGATGGLSIARSRLDASLVEVARARALAATVSAATVSTAAARQAGLELASAVPDAASVAAAVGGASVPAGGELDAMPLPAPVDDAEPAKRRMSFARRLMVLDIRVPGRTPQAEEEARQIVPGQIVSRPLVGKAVRQKPLAFDATEVYPETPQTLAVPGSVVARAQ